MDCWNSHCVYSFSGLIFLLNHPELSATIIHALRGGDEVNKEEFLPLRYASVLISRGFFCSPQEVGMIVRVHLRVVSYISRSKLQLCSPVTCLFQFH